MGKTGHLCGYVGIPKSHSLYGKKYNFKIKVENIEDIKINNNWLGAFCETELDKNLVSISTVSEVHGGITYSEDHLSCFDGIFENLWWFGFDCLHCDDVRPFMDDIEQKYPQEGVYRNFEYVKNETIKLSNKLKELNNFAD
jgi:hypothetical protein